MANLPKEPQREMDELELMKSSTWKATEIEKLVLQEELVLQEIDLGREIEREWTSWHQDLKKGRTVYTSTPARKSTGWRSTGVQGGIQLLPMSTEEHCRGSVAKRQMGPPWHAEDNCPLSMRAGTRACLRSWEDSEYESGEESEPGDKHWWS